MSDCTGILEKQGLFFLSTLKKNGEKYPEFAIDFLTSKKFNLDDQNFLSNLTKEQLAQLRLLDYSIGKYLYDKNSNMDENREKILDHDSSSSTNFQYVIGGLLMFFALVYVVSITWVPIPSDNVRFADTTLGFMLGTVISTLINFFFGTSVKKSVSSTTTTKKK